MNDGCTPVAADPAGPPDGLIALYRELMTHRQADWAGDLTGHWGDSSARIAAVSRRIREHPYWRTLPGPAAVARTARELRRLGTGGPGVSGLGMGDLGMGDSGRCDSDEGCALQPFQPVSLEVDLTFPTGPKDPLVRRMLARELDETGLWDGLSEADRQAERRYVERTGDPLRFTLLHRDRAFAADTEILAESGVLDQLDAMAPALAAAGVALDVLMVSDPYRPGAPGSEDYVLEINGRCCEVWTAKEAEHAGPPWYESMIRPLIVINELLEAAGSAERLYADPGAEFVYLLPMRARDVIVKDVYEGYDEQSLVLADRSVWNVPA